MSLSYILGKLEKAAISVELQIDLSFSKLFPFSTFCEVVSLGSYLT
jgi:hypothetical protein